MKSSENGTELLPDLPKEGGGTELVPDLHALSGDGTELIDDAGIEKPSTTSNLKLERIKFDGDEKSYHSLEYAPRERPLSQMTRAATTTISEARGNPTAKMPEIERASLSFWQIIFKGAIAFIVALVLLFILLLIG